MPVGTRGRFSRNGKPRDPHHRETPLAHLRSASTVARASPALIWRRARAGVGRRSRSAGSRPGVARRRSWRVPSRQAVPRSRPKAPPMRCAACAWWCG